ncbi:NUDIX hydrolase [Leucobacter denitrificans]|uniref:NUDIX hydrolase n=1 Tax=Leucobacter denitrificans TaxID=683042 RepID=UPI001CB6BE48|nr:hypothetical protein [Leucobacter denitrificans]
MRYEQASVSERRTMPPAIAVSAVAFAIEPPEDALLGKTGERVGTETTLWIPLVRRTREPFAGYWALPGGPTEWHETLTDTALRTLTAAVLREPAYLEQLYAFGAVERSAQAQRLVTIAYWAQYGERELASPPARPTPPQQSERGRARWDDPHPEPAPTNHADATPDPNVAWFSADRLPELAFDHREIVEYALWRLRVKTEYSAVAHRFLGPEFTLAQLRRVHEAILGQQVDPANFRRQVLATKTLSETGDYLTGSAHRPAKLYRFSADPESTAPEPMAPHKVSSTQDSAPKDHTLTTSLQGSMQ